MNSWLAISTAGSDFDTVLAVYTGDSLDSLYLVVGGASFVPVTPFGYGMTCHIAVDGFREENGAAAQGLLC